MKNKKIWLRILVLTLVFGMTVGCRAGDLAGGLDGTWVYENGQRGIIFNNGRYETFVNGGLKSHGTYYTSDKNITLNEIYFEGKIQEDVRSGTTSYSVRGNELTLGDGTYIETYTRKKEGIFKNRGGSRITERKLNGTWIDENGLELKFSNGRIEVFENGEHIDSTYTIFGNKIILKNNIIPVNVKGNRLTIENMTFTRKKDSNSSNRGSSRITERSLVGVWELENVVNISRREVTDRDEFFKDGTGLSSQGSRNVSFTWRLRDGNRLQMDTVLETDVSVIEISERGKLLTYYLDDARSKKAMYRKK